MTEYDRAKAVETCQSKRWYETEEEAQRVARHSLYRHGDRQFVYQCVICRLWHLSSKPYNEAMRRGLERLEEQFQHDARRWREEKERER